MNKSKKILILPLAIVTMGLISCNPYAMKWHLISKEQAYTTIANIKAKQETLKVPRLCSISYSLEHLSNGKNVSFVYGTLDYDYNENYLKIIDAKLSAGSTKEVEINTLYILQATSDGKYYRYIPKSEQKIEIKQDVKKELEDEITNDSTEPTAGHIGHINFEKAIKGHIFIKREGTGIKYNNNVLDEISTYVDASTKISDENKGSSTITSEYYFQKIDDTSIEYNENTNAPIKYFPNVTIEDAKSLKRDTNIKFKNNYISTAEFTVVVTKNNNIEETYILNAEVTNNVVKDKIII